MATTVPGNSFRCCSSQATDSASRWLVGSSRSRRSGVDRSSLHSATRRFPPPHKVPTVSGGEPRRVALCKLLLSKPDLLLLDEPTNHLDAESVEWLEQFLTRFPGTVVAV